MKLGINLPQMGPAASGENMVAVAQKAEEVGFGSVWVTERLLFPANPRTPYPAMPDGSLPDGDGLFPPTTVRTSSATWDGFVGRLTRGAESPPRRLLYPRSVERRASVAVRTSVR